MTRRQAFKFELMPTPGQEAKMRQFAGCCRYTYNKALELQQKSYSENKKHLSYADLCKLLTAWRGETDWLADAPSQPLQQALKNLTAAYKNFFKKRSGLPRFKKRGRHDSFKYPDTKTFKIDQANSRVFLPKLGWMRYRNSREILGIAKNITVSIVAGKWYFSVQTEREVQTPVHTSQSVIGIDVGIKRFATLSDGSFIEPLNSFKRHENRLAKAQQIMSRKTKGSNNWNKAKNRVQKIQNQSANARKDYLHKITTTISKSHAVVVIEDLQVSNMSRSASGTIENPGKNVAAKSGLNKAILDQGWGMFRQMLEYKLPWRGGTLIAVPPQNTSRTCIVCGHVSAENRKSQAKFKCVACGFEGNADYVGAVNILRAGHALIACNAIGESHTHQEPSEAIRLTA